MAAAGGAGVEEEEEEGMEEKQQVVVKVGMVGDAQIGERPLPSRRPAYACSAHKGRSIVTTASVRFC